MSYPEPVLEPAAELFVRDTANSPYRHDRGIARGREAFGRGQRAADRPGATVEELVVPGGPSGSVAVRIVRPAGATGVLPVVLYLHGGGWVLGDARTHDRLVRELAGRAGAAVVFLHYSRAPEARYPVAIEECYAVLEWVAARGAAHHLDPSRLAVAGDSAGGAMAAAVTLMVKQRSGPALAAQLLFYPVTDAAFGTRSYQQFATGYGLRRDTMEWFWDQYTTDDAARAEITASPLRASTDQLAGLPPAMVVVAEADVVRDEGEAYAAKLRAAGVPVAAVRFQGIVHDFVLLDALRHTQAARAATTQAGRFLREALH